MKKSLLGLALLGAALALGPNLCPAAGFPTWFYLNGQGTSSAINGVTFAGGGANSAVQPSAAANTPLVLCTSAKNCGWAESIVFDTAAGLSNTTTVYLLDCSQTANCTSSTAMVDSFTLLTNTTQAVANSGVGIGGLRTSLSRIILDDYFHQGVAIMSTNASPVTVTGSITLGQVVNSNAATVK